MFTSDELLMLLTIVMDSNAKNSSTLEKYPDNKTVSVKLEKGKKLQSKIAFAYADSLKVFSQSSARSD